jgi:hypothetical protein
MCAYVKCVYACMYAYTYTVAPTPMSTCTKTHSNIHAHAQNGAHPSLTHTHRHRRMHIHAYIHTHIHPHSGASPHAHPPVTMPLELQIHAYIHTHIHTHTVAPAPLFILPSQCLWSSVRNRGPEFGTQVPSTSGLSSSGATQLQQHQASSPSALSKRKPDASNTVNSDSETTTSLSLSVLKRKFQQREMAVNQTSRTMSSLSLLKRKFQQRHARAPSQQATSEFSHHRGDMSRFSTARNDFETCGGDQQEILLEEVAGEHVCVCACVCVCVYIYIYIYI